MAKHRFLDIRFSPPQELWLERKTNGLFEYGQGVYSQQVLKLVGVHPAPETISAQPSPSLEFGNPDQVGIFNDPHLAKPRWGSGESQPSRSCE